MYWLLNPRVIVAGVLLVALCATHFVAYRAGKAVVRSAWDSERLEMAAQALKAEERARAKEQQLLLNRQQAEKRYVDEKRKAATAAAAAQSDLDRLRNELATAPGGQAGADPTAADRAAGATGLERELLGNCAKTLADLAAEADRLEARVVGLQTYVKDVCLKQH